MESGMKKVLVVDDERNLARAVGEYLESHGYLIRTASDGLEALRVFKSFRPHAMVLDVMMPRENGYRVSRMIKTLGPRVGHVPKIVLVTSRNLGNDPEREETLNSFSMADAVLYKPFKFNDLLERIHTLIG